MTRECTCRGSCRGADGLGPGWVCALARRDRVELAAYQQDHDPGDEDRGSNVRSVNYTPDREDGYAR